MKIEINKDELLQKLNIVSKAIDTVSPIPALSGVKIDVKDNEVIFTGSNINYTIITVLDISKSGRSEGTGSIVIESRYLLDVVRKARSPMVYIETIDDCNNTRVFCGSRKYHMASISSDIYPDIKNAFTSTDHFKRIHLPKYIMETAAYIGYACCSDKEKGEKRPVLKGINFNLSNGLLEISATDSYRMSRYVVNSQEKESFNITIPKNVIEDVARYASGDIEICVNANQVQFASWSNRTFFTSTLLNGVFPNLSRIIPKEYEYSIKVDKEDLYQAIESSSFLKTDNIHVVKLDFNKGMILSSKSNEIGNSSEILDVEKDGDPESIALNGAFMMDAIKHVKSEDIILKINSKGMVNILDSSIDNIDQILMKVHLYD